TRIIYGFTLSYTLRGMLEPSKLKKAIVDVQELRDVTIRYTDDLLEARGLGENDVEGLIRQLYEPGNQAETRGAIIPGRELIGCSLPMKKLLRIGPKARPALQKHLGDLRIQNEVALILGAIGDETTVPALIDVYPESDRRRKKELSDDFPSAGNEKIVFIT